MKYALNLKTGGRILSATYARYAPGNAVLVEELPEGNLADYLYLAGEFVYSPLPAPEEPVPASDEVSWDAMAEAIMEGVNDV